MIKSILYFPFSISFCFLFRFFFVPNLATPAFSQLKIWTKSRAFYTRGHFFQNDDFECLMNPVENWPCCKLTYYKIMVYMDWKLLCAIFIWHFIFKTVILPYHPIFVDLAVFYDYLLSVRPSVRLTVFQLFTFLTFL